MLDRDFLETRGRILEVAAALDRIDRAPSRHGEPPDRRLAQLRQAIEALLEPGPGRAETVQHLFSLEYDPNWRDPTDRAAARSSTPRYPREVAGHAYIDPHIHMVSRTTDDYKRMALAGCVVVSEPAFWAGFDRSGPEGFRDYFRQLTEFEPSRARGLRHRALLLALHQRQGGRERRAVARGDRD